MMNYTFLVIMTIIGSFAALFLKKSSSSGNLRILIGNRNIYVGGLLYLISSLINIYLLKYMDYSVVLPFTSLTYVWTIIIARVYLGEIITKRKITGIGLIILGVWFISR